jgi:hypothetical protein
MADSSSVLSTSDLTPKYFLALVKGMVTVLFPLDTAANTDGGVVTRASVAAQLRDGGAATALDDAQLDALMVAAGDVLQAAATG